MNWNFIKYYPNSLQYISAAAILRWSSQIKWRSLPGFSFVVWPNTDIMEGNQTEGSRQQKHSNPEISRLEYKSSWQTRHQSSSDQRWTKDSCCWRWDRTKVDTMDLWGYKLPINYKWNYKFFGQRGDFPTWSASSSDVRLLEYNI